MPLSYMVVLLFLASIPDQGGTTCYAEHLLALVPPTVQNLLHVPAYNLLPILWILALRTSGMTARRSLYVALPVACAYGGIVELWQLSVPGRFASMTDFLFNNMGIVMFIWLYHIKSKST
jgi:VanZ family protein